MNFKNIVWFIKAKLKSIKMWRTLKCDKICKKVFKFYTNELRKTKDRQSETTSESSTTSVKPEDIAQNFRILRKCQNKFDWLLFEMFFLYKRTETNAKQTVRFNSPQSICLEQFLLRLCYFSIVFLTLFYIFYHILAFASFLSILTCFNIFLLI